MALRGRALRGRALRGRAPSGGDPTIRRIVFVTLDGAVGGGQVFLLYLLRWLRHQTDISTELLAWHGGPLLDRYAELTPVRVLDDLNEWRPARVFEVLGFQRLTGLLKSSRLRWWLVQRRRGDLLYVNGLEAARILGFTTLAGPRAVVHVHDIAELHSDRLTLADRQLITERAALFVAASDEIAEALHRELGVDRDRIIRHDYVIAGGTEGPLVSLHPPSRADLGIGADELVVGCTGPADWWKEPEQFVLLAWAVRRRLPDRPLRFLWVADDPDERLLWPFRHDLRNAGIDDCTTVVSGPRPFDFLGAMDVLVLSGRHEPPELLVFEAVGAGAAVVCTDNLLRDTPAQATTVVVPYLDIDALAQAVAELADDDEGRRALVARGCETARAHHDVTVGARRLLEVIER